MVIRFQCQCVMSALNPAPATPPSTTTNTPPLHSQSPEYWSHAPVTYPISWLDDHQHLSLWPLSSFLKGPQPWWLQLQVDYRTKPPFCNSQVVLFFRSRSCPCTQYFRAALLLHVIIVWLLCFDPFCYLLCFPVWTIDLLCFIILFALFCPSYFPVPLALALLINSHPSNILCVVWSPWHNVRFMLIVVFI